MNNEDEDEGCDDECEDEHEDAGEGDVPEHDRATMPAILLAKILRETPKDSILQQMAVGMLMLHALEEGGFEAAKRDLEVAANEGRGKRHASIDLEARTVQFWNAAAMVGLASLVLGEGAKIGVPKDGGGIFGACTALTVETLKHNGISKLALKDLRHDNKPLAEGLASAYFTVCNTLKLAYASVVAAATVNDGHAADDLGSAARRGALAEMAPDLTFLPEWLLDMVREKVALAEG